ncbi:predicted protein [Plenodomus lingam JN3]|uniref:Predicted protein n=1 Tax=Leptosphaeria maculans (strain JN3 / isolate v23.1.3 / race Av1-4-5-6-7-8) TaxID=985895 RepID=E5ACX6_LEPMJ|nr:predicted protein [Plenodomus lingam JN3]CBY02328.1 predicted protein [Plenodomus lingam JN3]
MLSESLARMDTSKRRNQRLPSQARMAVVRPHDGHQV